MMNQNTTPNLQPINPNDKFRKMSINTTDSDTKPQSKQGFFSRMIWGTREVELPMNQQDKQYNMMFGPKRRSSHILIQRNMLQDTNYQKARRYSSIIETTQIESTQNQMPTMSFDDLNTMGI